MNWLTPFTNRFVAGDNRFGKFGNQFKPTTNRFGWRTNRFGRTVNRFTMKTNPFKGEANRLVRAMNDFKVAPRRMKIARSFNCGINEQNGISPGGTAEMARIFSIRFSFAPAGA